MAKTQNPGPFPTLTEANHVPDKWFRGWTENHVDQPEGVEDFNAHPGKRGEQGIVEQWRHPEAHTLPARISQNWCKEEDEVEGSQ